MTALPQSVLYIVMVLIELFGLNPEFTADYLAEGVPVSAIEVVVIPDSERDIYVVTASPADLPNQASATSTGRLEAEISYRYEESDLISTNYLIYAPGADLPAVVSISPILSQFPELSSLANQIGDAPLILDLPEESAIEFPQGDDGGSDFGESAGGQLLILARDGLLIVSAPESGTMLIVEQDQ
jgi:hypothetical protein